MIVLDNPESNYCATLLEEVVSRRPTDWPEGDRRSKAFGIFDFSPDKKMMAGLLAYVHPGWAYIDLLWVSEALRGQGMGTLLIKRAEEEAVRRECHSAYLWTQDFEAPGFYKKQGYQQFVTFENFIPGHQRLGFMKRLAA